MRGRGYTILEIVIVLALIGVLAGISAAGMTTYIEKSRVADAIVSMKGIEDELNSFFAETGLLPASLADLGMGVPTDPWGNPYRYTNLGTATPGQARKDKFLVPINSDYDLWSMGPDGQSVPPLTAKSSRDDIIRANDGSFYGQASAY